MLIRCHRLARGMTTLPHVQRDAETPDLVRLRVATGPLGAARPGQQEPTR